MHLGSMSMVIPELMQAPKLGYNGPVMTEFKDPVMLLTAVLRNGRGSAAGGVSNLVKMNSGDVFIEVVRGVVMDHPIWSDLDESKSGLQVVDAGTLNSLIGEWDGDELLRPGPLQAVFGTVQKDRAYRPTSRTRLCITPDRRFTAATCQPAIRAAQTAVVAAQRLLLAYPGEQLGIQVLCTLQPQGRAGKNQQLYARWRDTPVDPSFAYWEFKASLVLGIAMFIPMNHAMKPMQLEPVAEETAMDLSAFDADMDVSNEAFPF